ncbi:MAG: efflux RND transporter periplasmic adaptor subunit [Verrucomicrobia bacterium]|nr:efflux RND transporter periplasmic adaptor subunit [Verrucomicrobiota bacterium]
MDVARPDIARKKKRKRLALLFIVILGIAGITFALARLGPALPRVDAAAIWTNQVQRGELLVEVRGNGSLVPEQLQFVQTEVGGTVQKIHVLPGALVEPETILLELSNVDLKQDIFDREWAIKALEAGKVQIEVRQEGDRLNKELSVAKFKADYEYAALEAEAYRALEADGLIAALEAKRFILKAEDLVVHYTNELKSMAMDQRSTEAELAVKEADLMKMRAALNLKKQQFTNLTVWAGIKGVLQEIGDRSKLEVGQRMPPSATLAKIVLPDQLKAQLQIPETLVKDVVIGQKASIDTRNGLIPGTVSRVDPAVNNGTVTVDVRLQGALPLGARPDLSVDGTVEIARLADALFVARPVKAVPDAEGSVFRISADGRKAVRVPV